MLYYILITGCCGLSHTKKRTPDFHDDFIVCALKIYLGHDIYQYTDMVYMHSKENTHEHSDQIHKQDLIFNMTLFLITRTSDPTNPPSKDETRKQNHPIHKDRNLIKAHSPAPSPATP
jgi:hypothetical protein